MTENLENENENGTAAEAEEWTLPGNRVRVTLEDAAPFVIRVTNRERVRWDMTFKRQGWPPAEEAPFLAQTYMAWSASVREGKTDLKWEAFRDRVEDLEGLEKAVDHPTRTGPQPGS